MLLVKVLMVLFPIVLSLVIRFVPGLMDKVSDLGMRMVMDVRVGIASTLCSVLYVVVCVRVLGLRFCVIWFICGTLVTIACVWIPAVVRKLAKQSGRYRPSRLSVYCKLLELRLQYVACKWHMYVRAVCDLRNTTCWYRLPMCIWRMKTERSLDLAYRIELEERNLRKRFIQDSWSKVSPEVEPEISLNDDDDDILDF